MEAKQGKFNVGGILLNQPFKIRRLGHFGFNYDDILKAVSFYTDLMGFQISDEMDFARLFPGADELLKGVGETRGFFTRYGTDHHSFVIFSQRVMKGAGFDTGAPPENTINQITWQVGSLKEIADSIEFFRSRGVKIQRIGRDMPGSNWHIYVWDPDGHINELYFGIEQVGWTGHSKPQSMYSRRFFDLPPLPQIPERVEVQDAMESGIDVFSGYREKPKTENPYDVGGILLPRPFKITKIGPVSLFVKDLAASEAFYSDIMGFRKSEEVMFKGHRCVYLRCGTEHHSIALYPKELRSELGLSPHTTSMSFGLELGNYQQLRDAVSFLTSKGIKRVTLPGEIHPGIDYAGHFWDTERHCLQLYYYMEQIGWDGKVRPREQRRVAQAEWPEVLEALSDTYLDQTFQGPIG
jgi:catechol 2,3-dioxygenase-like lactoylglutathione lyase family enzyme